ncbi:hypothetical protein [Candidatus Cloacimonas acidaminovorans]|jgi:hypothetical protein|uniref:Uncharacterized protein n=1 Tax=Cloacimonas acidaminovorans (strain Evry) TaxID=459349 RepID=B0VGR1_CLOAI|nr:hypothetical protein [Candidatus Cloacimonas acidaminovorans]CAO80498.1 hypothetical protein CLOAM0613 [Candidatus Cloacimonas acidaminovorans str. Evry]HNV61314.1 hypothetical protein [Candidatus Cloacimonas acidaminovorans]HPU99335.1 hypothetical protein [Candidatus Cloacimonas acidaminovorans]
MNDLNDKMKERWKDKRKKAYNWPKLIIMVLALIIILYLMNHLGNTKNVVQNPSASVTDTLQADTLQKEIIP